MNEQTVAFIMAERLTYENLRSNPWATYIFLEAGGAGPGNDSIYEKSMRNRTRNYGEKYAGAAIIPVTTSGSVSSSTSTSNGNCRSSAPVKSGNSSTYRDDSIYSSTFAAMVFTICSNLPSSFSRRVMRKPCRLVKNEVRGTTQIPVAPRR